MKLATDVDYQKDRATAAGVLFRYWQDKNPVSEVISKVDQVKGYIPGQFYKRELPCILKLINEHQLSPEYIIVDGYVFLDGNSAPGLGKYLYNALDKKIPVIGVAKTPFKGIAPDYQIFRGDSKKPLFITAAGMPVKKAREYIIKMHGKHRIPALLKYVDLLARKA